MRGTTDDVRANFTGISSKMTSSIFLSFMVEEALFRIVLVRQLALLSFKVEEINVDQSFVIVQLRDNVNCGFIRVISTLLFL